MTVNILLDIAQPPSEELIKTSLGKTWTFYEELCALTASCEQDWRRYGKKYGWKLKIHADDKTLLELTVADGWFLVAMAIREKERQELMAASAAGQLADLADAAAVFPEGHAIKIEVRDQTSCDQAKALLTFVKTKRSLA